MDEVKRQVDIDAPAERVWQLISRPGWFVNGGEVVDHETEDLGDGVHLVRDPVHGEFRIETVELVPFRYAAFRWLGANGEDSSTLVELWIENKQAGRDGQEGVTLTVVESGFESLGPTEMERRRRHTTGWETELAALGAHLALEAVA
ncbi:MAG TPA: ATPase [Candidatus Nocardiopsis merdipullorum]|nr:ATPase [Candidatus Nocardiopsis merdipullorum]